MDPLQVELPADAKSVLQAIALAGILGGTPEEVAAYLITREIDDMLRSGSLKLESEPAA